RGPSVDRGSSTRRSAAAAAARRWCHSSRGTTARSTAARASTRSGRERWRRPPPASDRTPTVVPRGRPTWPASSIHGARLGVPIPTRRCRGGPHMGVIIIREMVGTSPSSWSDAARQAVATASKTVRNIQTVEVVKSTAVVENGEIVEYHVELKIGFEYEG